MVVAVDEIRRFRQPVEVVDDRDAGRADPEAAGLVATLAATMQAVHAAGIVHRDLKPANVLLTPDGVPKITDFGLVKFIGGGAAATTTGVVKGTPGYMAPEQASADARRMGPATDIHALGAMLFEMLTGRLPYQGENTIKTLMSVVNDPAPPLRNLRPDLPADLEAICLKCLAKRPEERYASAGELAEDLGRFLRHERVRAPRHHAGRWRTRLVTGAGLVCFAAAAAVTAWPPAPEPYPEPAIRDAAAGMRAGLIDRLAGNRTPDGWILRRFDNPDPAKDREVWSHSQCLAAAMSAPEPGGPRDLSGSLEVPFTLGSPVEAGGRRRGWISHPHECNYTTAQPALYTAHALCEAYRRLDEGDASGRERIRRRLDYLADVLAHHHPPGADGGWTMFPRQDDPRQASRHATAVALAALLSARRSGVDFTRGRRDELIAAAAGHLIRGFEPDGPRPGWRCVPGVPGEVADGLTLQIYGVLLAAEAEAGVELPESLTRHIPVHLADCGQRKPDYPRSSFRNVVRFRNHEGAEVTSLEPTEFLWYPWAIECAQRWMERRRRAGAGAAELAEPRTILGRLVIDLGPQMSGQAGRGWSFVAAETITGLSAVPAPK